MHAQPLAVQSLSHDQERALRANLSRWSRRFLDLPPDAFDDAYQGAWRKVLEQGEAKGRPTRNLEHALRWGIRTSWLDECRRARRHPAHALEATPETALAQAVPDVAQEAEAHEAARHLFRAAAALTPRQWRVVLLRCGWGLSPDEVCLALDISWRMFRSEHARAQRTLKAAFAHETNGDPERALWPV